jgi:hypothetical protein
VPDGAGGRDDYSGPFDPHFELEHLSRRALLITLRELAIQGHLLARAMMAAIERRHTHDEAVDVGRALFTGIGWIASERLARALGAGEIVEALVHGVDPTAVVTAADAPGAVHAWTVHPGTSAPAKAPDPVALVRFSTGVDVTLRRRVPLP